MTHSKVRIIGQSFDIIGIMKKNIAYKYRIYPNAEQQVLFAKAFGCTRFVYNTLLEEKKKHYEETGKSLRNTPAHLKADYEWLKEADSLALSNAQLQLETAFRNFFRNKAVGYPKFKSKKDLKHSYTTNMVNGNIRITESNESRKNGTLRLPKVGEVRIKLHRKMAEDHAIKSVTVSREASGKYYASILTEYTEGPATQTISSDAQNIRALGMDYSSGEFYVDSEGRKAEMPHFYRNTEEKLSREQRRLSKMKMGSCNYEKQRRKVALVHEKLKDQRKDWQHKESKHLTDSYDVICVEDIDYREMAQGLHLAKATSDNAFGQFRTFLSYKAESKGKKLITIDKWFASSKLCSGCGYKKEALTLQEREWTCPCCGTHHDRDVNAAINIREEGLRLLAL